MPKRKYDLILKKLENRFKEKRGTGVRLKKKMPISFKTLDEFIQSTSHLKAYYYFK